MKINPQISEKATHAIGQSGDSLSQSNKNSTKTETHNVDKIIEGKKTTLTPVAQFNQMIQWYTKPYFWHVRHFSFTRADITSLFFSHCSFSLRSSLKFLLSLSLKFSLTLRLLPPALKSPKTCLIRASPFLRLEFVKYNQLFA